jgi:hypothetical protein
VRILQFIDIAMLATQITYIRDEKYGLKRGLPAEKPGSEKPLTEIKKLLHIY